MDFSTHHHHHEPEFPIPITTAYVGLHHDSPSNGPSNLITSNNTTTTAAATTTTAAAATTTTIKYRECLKNHAASLGGHALDGCGEFMASGDDGTPDALRCSACHCHRNFHRKEVEGGDFPPFESTYLPPPPHHPLFTNNTTTRKVVGQKGVLISNTNNSGSGLIPRATHHQHMIMPVGGGGAMQTSESDEIEVYRPRAPQLMKKRFRTKFTSEQKDKMLEFAERFEWRIPRADEREVQLFCQEIGVRRRVLKVWMHNNKHNFARKTSIPTINTSNTAAASSSAAAAAEQPE